MDNKVFNHPSLILDANCHLGSSSLICYLTERHYGAEDLMRVMDACGITQACVSGDGFPHMIHQMNMEVLQAVARYPDRLIGFVRINPWDDDAVEQLDFYIGEKGFKGIRLHPMADGYCLLLEPNLDPILEKAAQYGVPVYIHSGNEPWSMPGQVLDLARCFPEISFIMGHVGLNNLYQHAIASAGKVGNVLIESSIGPAVWAVKELGKDRVVFGSEWPATSMRCQLAKIQDADLTEEEKRCVLGGNLRRLLNLGESPGDSPHRALPA
ncbi:MAG: amidohydrolase family protein [Acidobacteriota bacterium]|nr:amidohydrolase family protein [Blastocatellia bacterium]MDW8240958.1 amidohydrolase family protein [Acidobacteriota bacterium]